jgi:hypothetical protein
VQAPGRGAGLGRGHCGRFVRPMDGYPRKYQWRSVVWLCLSKIREYQQYQRGFVRVWLFGALMSKHWRSRVLTDETRRGTHQRHFLLEISQAVLVGTLRCCIAAVATWSPPNRG